MSGKSEIIASVRTLCEPIAEGLGLVLWDVTFTKEDGELFLRLIIDKDGGVGIEDCVALNDAVDAPLDELDPIDGEYRLQVQSPGPERELSRDAHFKRFIGSKIKIKLHKGLDGVKELHGTLSAYDGDSITIFTDKEISLERTIVAKVRLDDSDLFI